MKYKFVFAIIFLFLFIIPFVSSAGVCALDKFDYHPGETASFDCACSLPTEEGATGNIVWRNSTGFVLQNVSANSGLCRTSIFGDSFIFPIGADYLGNVTFETADVAWVGDIVSDDFNVSGFHVSDCLIVDIEGSSSIKVGGWGAVKFEVQDGLTGERIIHASCIADGYDVSGAPLVFEPSESGNVGSKLTSAKGEVGFTHKLIESFWEVNTTYNWEFHCYSLPNVSFVDTAHVAFLETSGNAAGMKTCTAEMLFTTNGDDLRPTQTSDGQGSVILGTILALLAAIAVLVGLGIYTKWMPFKIFLISAGSLLLMFTIGYVASLDAVLGVNAVQGNAIEMLYVLFTIGILGGLIGLVLFLVILALDFFRFRRGLTSSFFGKDRDDDD